MGKAVRTFFIVIGVLAFASCVMTCGSALTFMQEQNTRVAEESILFLKLEGVIIDGSEFLDNLRKYAKNDSIKGVLVQINSPGGVVGPSQEIYSEFKRVQKDLNKPIVVSGSGLVASGGYYAAVGASKIVTNPGTMMGSIGVIMSFANLERLYSWAKIERYSITTGKFKDSGADYRPMRNDERNLFQAMINEVQAQFTKAVAEGRGMDLNKVKMYADGRVFTGETAVRLGFADQLGTLEDARQLAGELSGLGKDPTLFTPPKKRPDIFEILGEVRGPDLKQTLNLNLIGKPLYIVPSVIE